MTDPARQAAQPGDASVDPGTDLARQLAGFAGILLSPGGGAQAADRVVALALRALDSCDEVSLCGRNGRSAQASPSRLVALLDDLEVQSVQGPCHDVLVGAVATYVPDLLDDYQWPVFAPTAALLGVRSVLAQRLSVDGETVGALVFYAYLPGAFDASDRTRGLLFATYAGLALAQATSEAEQDSKVENLQSALASREVIGQAQGILMERERITAEQAFQLLRRSSQRFNLKLRAVAQDVVDTGYLAP